MPVTIEPALYPYLLVVAANMRERDREEIFGMWWEDDPEFLARKLAGLSKTSDDMAYVACSAEGVPVCAFGFYEMWPGMWSAWMFATDQLPKVAKTVIKFLRKKCLPELLRRGAHRVECKAHENNAWAGNFIERMGGVKETVMLDYGRDRSNYVLYRWLRADHEETS